MFDCMSNHLQRTYSFLLDAHNECCHKNTFCMLVGTYILVYWELFRNVDRHCHCYAQASNAHRQDNTHCVSFHYFSQAWLFLMIHPTNCITCHVFIFVDLMTLHHQILSH
jgi:hypothetical protein